MSTHARPLAEALAGRAEEDLLLLLTRREIRADAPWNDLFDAAEALLDPAAITRFLPRLTREEAEGLAGAVHGAAVHGASGPPASEGTAALVALALLAPDGTPYPPVAAAVAGLPDPPIRRGVPDAPALSSEDVADAALAARGAEHAFTTVAILADLMLLTQDTPLALLAGGTIGASEKRRAVERGLPDDGVLIDDLLVLGIAADLLRAADRTLRLTSLGEDWLGLPGVERWTMLAEGFLRRLPAGLRRPGGGWIDPGAWPDAYPWDSAWPEAAAAHSRRAELLGLVADGRPTPWAAPMRDGGKADVTLLRAALPAEVDRVFLQNDLSAIAPGPLLPTLDLRLRTMAEREPATQASSYRFTADSLAAGLAVGETERSIIAFLEEISLTGVPQPLRYLVSQATQRHGLVRITADPVTGRTSIDSADPHLLDAIGVDHALRPLGLVRDGAALSTRVGRETVFWALTDEHYPAALIGPDGADERALRVPALSPNRDEDAAHRYRDLLHRLRSAQGPDADAAWLDRELEHAVRQRAVLAVEVAMPDGSTRELVLEVTGLGGGRLRGRDRAADVERTLPIRSIRSTRLVPADGTGS